MALRNVAKETLDILETGGYITDSGKPVTIMFDQRAAVNRTDLYTPEKLRTLLAKQNVCGNSDLVIEVTDEATPVAAHRLVQLEDCHDLVVLNHASARKPGGGFISGDEAQEEDLARCSGLYPCLMTQPIYYQANQKQNSLLYTDHIIYSPEVPWFRTDGQNLLEAPFLASVISAPAPDAGEILRHNEEAGPVIEETFKRRAGFVLTVAREHRHRSLLLGAWGCGIQGNDPHLVASIFGDWLVSREFNGCFNRVVFAINDTSEGNSILRAFQERFQ